MKKTYSVDKNIKSLVNNLENNEIFEELPAEVGEYMFNDLERNNNIIKIKGESKEIKLIGKLKKSQEIKNSDYNEVDCSLLIKYENKIWYLPNTKSVEIDLIPIVRSIPHSKNKYSKSVIHEYYFETDIFLEGDESIPFEKDNYKEYPVNENIIINKLSKVNDIIPIEWYGLTEDDDLIYIRYRSGSLKIYRTDEDTIDYEEDEIIFEAFIGDEFPGITLNSEEVKGIIKSIDYINFNYPLGEVSQNVLDNHFNLNSLD